MEWIGTELKFNANIEVKLKDPDSRPKKTQMKWSVYKVKLNLFEVQLKASKTSSRGTEAKQNILSKRTVCWLQMKGDKSEIQWKQQWDRTEPRCRRLRAKQDSTEERWTQAEVNGMKRNKGEMKWTQSETLRKEIEINRDSIEIQQRLNELKRCWIAMKRSGRKLKLNQNSAEAKANWNEWRPNRSETKAPWTQPDLYWNPTKEMWNDMERKWNDIEFKGHHIEISEKDNEIFGSWFFI